jgi:hypothetical protein
LPAQWPGDGIPAANKIIWRFFPRVLQLIYKPRRGKKPVFRKTCPHCPSPLSTTSPRKNRAERERIYSAPGARDAPKQKPSRQLFFISGRRVTSPVASRVASLQCPPWRVCKLPDRPVRPRGQKSRLYVPETK